MGYKLKNKSSAKKRFRYTKGGKGDKIVFFGAKRRHNMKGRANKAMRQSKGPMIAAPETAKIIKKYLHK